MTAILLDELLDVALGSSSQAVQTKKMVRKTRMIVFICAWHRESSVAIGRLAIVLSYCIKSARSLVDKNPPASGEARQGEATRERETGWRLKTYLI